MKKTVVLSKIAIVTAIAAITTPAMADQLHVDGEYVVLGGSAAGGISGALGTIKKQTTSTDTGHVSEGDLSVTINKNGVTSVNGSFRDAGYAVQENMVRANGPASGALSATAVGGGMHVNIKENGGL